MSAPCGLYGVLTMALVFLHSDKQLKGFLLRKELAVACSLTSLDESKAVDYPIACFDSKLGGGFYESSS